MAMQGGRGTSTRRFHGLSYFTQYGKTRMYSLIAAHADGDFSDVHDYAIQVASFHARECGFRSGIGGPLPDV